MRQNATLVIFRVLALVIGLSATGQAGSHARTSQSVQNLCDTATVEAAKRSGVPVQVLLAISRVETGRAIGGVLSPWPWAVNQAGSGIYFDTKSEAIDHVSKAMSEGQSNIDIGCFQINLRWHGKQFSSLDAMFDAADNADYAARFLMQLYQEHGSWAGAIGAYHSRQSTAATAYMAKVSALMEAPPQGQVLPAAMQNRGRDNRYPLLRPGVTGGNGSLVATASDRTVVPLFW